MTDNDQQPPVEERADDSAEESAVAEDPAVEDRREPTGVRGADDARERLHDVDDAPLEEHVDVYEDVHRRLQEGLADLDEG